MRYLRCTLLVTRHPLRLTARRERHAFFNTLFSHLTITIWHHSSRCNHFEHRVDVNLCVTTCACVQVRSKRQNGHELEPGVGCVGPGGDEEVLSVWRWQ